MRLLLAARVSNMPVIWAPALMIIVYSAPPGAAAVHAVPTETPDDFVFRGARSAVLRREHHQTPKGWNRWGGGHVECGKDSISWSGELCGA